MPLIGGTTSWVGPLIGAILLGSLQQIATVTISSAVNLLIVGCLLVGFVIVAPNGILGLVHKYLQRKPDDFVGRRRVDTDAPGAASAPCAGTLRRTCAMTDLLEVDNLGKRFGGFVALENISLSVPAGERLGLIGPNGSGKSTLVNCICGTLHNEHGLGAFRRPHARRARRASAHAARAGAQLPAAAAVRQPEPDRQHAHPAALHGGGARRAATPRRDIEARCIDLLREVGLEAKARQLPRDLTQVEMRKLELARAMAAEPKLLIADEAMAGLTHSEIEDILTLLVRLNEQGVTIILIEHIMRAVMSFSRRLVVLVSGRKIADGQPDDVMRDPEVERAYLGQ